MPATTVWRRLDLPAASSSPSTSTSSPIWFGDSASAAPADDPGCQHPRRMQAGTVGARSTPSYVGRRADRDPPPSRRGASPMSNRIVVAMVLALVAVAAFANVTLG